MQTKPYKFTPEEFQQKCNEYFDYCDNNPIYKYDVVKTGDTAGTVLKIPNTRPYSIEGIINFLDIDRVTFYNYCKEETAMKNKQIFNIATRARRKIQADQIDGALAGTRQPMIASRLNHLKEETETTTTNIDATGKSSDEIRAAIQAIENARKGKD